MSALGDDTIRRLKDDPVFFAKVIMGYSLYDYQAELVRAPSRRVVACWGRQSGKTTAIAVKVIHFCYTQPNKTVLIVSKGLRQSIIMYSVITNFVLGNPLLRKSVARYTRTQMFLKNGSRVIALPCSQDGANLRGHTADMVIMDEAAFMPEGVITSVIFPMLATTDGLAIMLSTPYGRNHIFYRSFINPKFWTQRVPSTRCPRISADFLLEQKLLIGDLRYRIEYMAEFIEDQNALFTQDMIRTAVELYDDSREVDQLITDQQLLDQTKVFRGSYYLGSDLGKRFDYSVIVVLKKVRVPIIDKENGETRILDPVYRLVYLKQFELKTKLKEVTNWIKFLDGRLKLQAGAIDQTGIGEASYERLEDDCPNVEGIAMYGAQTKQEVIMYLYTEMEKWHLAIPNDKELITQMNEQEFFYGAVRKRDEIETEEKGVMLFKHPEGRHDDQLWALALAMYSTRDYKSKSGIIL